jgi:peptidoglycan/LPS O-acetylase OafA/YrhL
VATVALVIAVSAMLFYVVERPARTRLRDRAGKIAEEQYDKAATAAIDG